MCKINENICFRCVEEAKVLLQKKCSIRECGLLFKLSKSTVHLDLSKRLKKVDFLLYKKVQILLKKNFENKHIKGGEKTKEKFLKIKGKLNK